MEKTLATADEEVKEYRLVQDESSHWYIIPAKKLSEFWEWQEIDEDDPAAWIVPEWAQLLNKSIESVVFGNWRID